MALKLKFHSLTHDLVLSILIEYRWFTDLVS